MALVNLTPHAIVLRDEHGNDTTIPPSGNVARVATFPGDPAEDYRAAIDSPVPVLLPDDWGEVENLPPPHPGVAYIVSALVGAAMEHSDRADLVVPGTSPADKPVRNDAGHIVAVRCLKLVVDGAGDDEDWDEDDEGGDYPPRRGPVQYERGVLPLLDTLEEMLDGEPLTYQLGRQDAAILMRVAPRYSSQGELDAEDLHSLLGALVRRGQANDSGAMVLAESFLNAVGVEWI